MIKGIIKKVQHMINPAAKVRDNLISKYGPERGMRLFEKAKEISRDHDLTLQEAAAYTQTLAFRMAEVGDAAAEIMKTFGATMAKMAENISKFIKSLSLPEIQAAGAAYEKQQRVMSYRKKKSQAKNWSKWKKRR
jgi:hypothetical protein